MSKKKGGGGDLGTHDYYRGDDCGRRGGTASRERKGTFTVEALSRKSGGEKNLFYYGA